MTKEEFMRSPRDFGFCIHPLDMDLAKMQFAMLKRMKEEKPEQLAPMVEAYDSNYRDRGFRKTTLSVRECGQNETGISYLAEFTIANERANYVTSAPLFLGGWEDMLLFIDGRMRVRADHWDFFSLCKAYALWYDWQIKNGVFDSTSASLKGKAKYLGWGNAEGARGVFVSIARGLLDGCKLIMRSDACVAYVENNDIRHAAEEFGVGLRFVEVHATSEFSIEATYEPIPCATPRFIHVNRGRQMSPRNAYILATDFSGGAWIDLYREDADGNRIRLWCGDFENK